MHREQEDKHGPDTSHSGHFKCPLHQKSHSSSKCLPWPWIQITLWGPLVHSSMLCSVLSNKTIIPFSLSIPISNVSWVHTHTKHSVNVCWNNAWIEGFRPLSLRAGHQETVLKWLQQPRFSYLLLPDLFLSIWPLSLWFSHSGHLPSGTGQSLYSRWKSWGSQRNESQPKTGESPEPKVCHQVQRTQVRPINKFRVRGLELLRSGTKWEQCQEYSKKTSLSVQWLRFYVPKVGAWVLLSGKIPHEAQYDKKKKKKEYSKEILINCYK